MGFCRLELQVVFCDFSRLIRNDDGNYWDPARDEFVDHDDQDFVQCATTGVLPLPYLAYTAFDRRQTYGDPPRVPPTIIQLCPWFVRLINEKKHATGLLEPTFQNLAANLFIAGGKFTGHFNYMDLFNLLDHVLMHEMTHVDVPRRDDGVDEFQPGHTAAGATDVGGWNGYTWLRVASNFAGGK